MFVQLVQPDLGVRDATGMCLRFAQSVFGAPARHKSAAIAANHTKFRHHTRLMPDVACVVWFSHWGTYGAPPSYEDWGHVVVWVPGCGFLSSPGRGYGQTWYSSLEEIERVFAGSFLFWSEDINGLRVCEPVEAVPVVPVAPIIEDEDDMSVLYARATADSSLTGVAPNQYSEVWASPDGGTGERKIDGIRYSGVWAVEAGVARRLTAHEWEIVQGAYKAADRKLPIADVHGNTIEVLLHGPKHMTPVESRLANIEKALTGAKG